MYHILDDLCRNLGIKCTKDEEMSRHCSFKIGGKADRFIEIDNKKELKEVLDIIYNKIPFLIIGNGSNLLIDDNGIRAVVLSLKGDFKKIELIDEETVRCGAGVMLSSLCNFAKDNSLSGLEFAYGIPGTAGGAAYMNAGAYGGEMKDVIFATDHFLGNEDGRFLGDEHQFSYRHSVYTDKEYIITDLYLKLKKGEKEQIEKKMDELMFARKSKQPIEFPSAGSTFKRPTGYFAAALIEECGLKGFSVGDAQVSEKHSGFVINKGKASFLDVISLTEKVKKIVKEKKNVELELEIKIIK